MSGNDGKPKRITHLGDLIHLSGNPNVHTERGSQMVTDSIQTVGFADSMTVDRDGVVLSGNQRLESLGEAQGSNNKPGKFPMGEPIVVQSDGTRPIIHQRVDLKVSDERARRLVVTANRSQELNLSWSPEALKALDVDLSGMWTEKELGVLFGEANGSSGLATPDSKYAVLIECESEQVQVEMLRRFSDEGLMCRALIS